MMNENEATIFVIVEVTYDYYRFQENRGAATDIETARAIAAEQAVIRGYRDEALPVIEESVESSGCDYSERAHIWIERWPQNAESELPDYFDQ